MTTYIGLSTINASLPKSSTNNINTAANTLDGGVGSTTQGIVWGKKYTLTDSQLVLQDFINALNIPQGSKVGQPGYGTTIWNFIFEPNTLDIQTDLENEIRRVASLDSRMKLGYVKSYAQENGILVEVEISVSPFNNVTTAGIFFSQLTNTAGFS
jgi:phage baseplate assembly protein W